jgi:dTDP-4-dehydrorhamnose 3,5-epimerase
MNLSPTKISGCYRVELRPILDARGYFVSPFDLATVRGVDPSFTILRVNRSHTQRKGAIRGLHFQRPPMAEDKLVQCLRGAIFDVCVDIRPDSPTYLQWVGFELSAENQELSLVPRGCAHGFQTLSEDCLVEYFVGGVYSPPHEGGMRWDDPSLGIAWPLPCSLTSERDAAWPLLARRGT